MELLTDILAIFGWSLFGIWVTPAFYKNSIFDNRIEFTGFFALGLIAASLVLG